MVVAKNPCYLLGDIRVLSAVNVEGFNHLVDCIVFPTNGKRPHPSEIAGSDLDGDQYFVSWDDGLAVLHTAEPYEYPSVDAMESSTEITRSMLIDYFAGHRNSMGKIDTCYKYWADRKGAGCNECVELGKLFSRSVDASKTGDHVSIPDRLKPVLEESNTEVASGDSASESCTRVWQEMDRRAKEQKMAFSEAVVLVDDPIAIDEEFVLDLLQNRFPNLSEFQLFKFLLRWCSHTYSSDKEYRFNLLKLARHIKFGEFTVDQQVEAIDAGIPPKMVTNALNKSLLLPQSLLQKFLLSDPHHTWRFYFHSDSSEFNWKHLLRGIQHHPESMVIISLSNKITFVLHFLLPPELGETDISDGSIVTYFSSARFDLDQQCVLGSNFKLELNDQTLQLYQQHKGRTFIWLSCEQPPKRDSSADILFDRISVDLTRFQRNIFEDKKHPKVNKENLLSIEVFVRSFSERPAYLDVVEVGSPQVGELLSLDELEELPSNSEDDQSEEGDECILHPLYSLQDELSKCAQKGDFHNFQIILNQILSGLKDISSVPDLLTALQSLLKSMVTKCCHRPPRDGAEDSLQIIITSLSSLLKSPFECLKLLSRVCQLPYPDLAARALEMSLTNVESSRTSDFFEVSISWKLWYFIPQKIALRLVDHLYTLFTSASLYSECGSTDSQERHEALSQNITTNMSLDQVKYGTSKYVNHFTRLLVISLLNEISSLKQQDQEKNDDTSMQLVKMKTYAPSSPSGDDKESCVIGFNRPQRGVFSSKKFTPGSYVAVSLMKKLDSSSKITSLPVAIGQIVKVSCHPTDIQIRLEESIPLCLKQSIRLQRGHWQLNLIANVTGFSRALRALRDIEHNSSDVGLLSGLALSHTQCAVSPLNLTGLKSFLSQHMYDSKVPAEINGLLNPSQQEAVKAALKQRVTLIHGPPGTGKTHVACEIVKSRLTGSPDAVLVTAETNLAVDNLCEKLLVMGIRVVRVGKLDQMSPSIRAISLEAQIQRKKIDSEDGKSRSRSTDVQKILGAAQVVAATCTGAGDPSIKGMKFPFVIIDEATQVTEPTSLIPLVHGCEQLILIGDPEQLAPVVPVVSTLADTTLSKLSVTLFHRLQKLLSPVFLNEQHRMHSELAAFPSRKFYAGRLVTAPSCNMQAGVSLKVPLLRPHKPLVFFETCKVKHSEKHVGTSFSNALEAEAVSLVAKYLIRHEVSMLRMAVLTPYSGQVRCIREVLEREKLSRVEVFTVDAFQGREMDFVLFSTVRCNTRGELGFTDDRYRMNVLLTRAKYALVGIGCSWTLRHSELWNEWLDELEAVGKVSALDEVKDTSGAPRAQTDDRRRGRPGSEQRRVRSSNATSGGSNASSSSSQRGRAGMKQRRGGGARGSEGGAGGELEHGDGPGHKRKHGYAQTHRGRQSDDQNQSRTERQRSRGGGWVSGRSKSRGGTLY